MEISYNKKKNPRSNMQQKEDKASREEEAKMTQNQILNEKTWQEKKKKIATSKKF